MICKPATERACLEDAVVVDLHSNSRKRSMMSSAKARHARSHDGKVGSGTIGRPDFKCFAASKVLWIMKQSSAGAGGAGDCCCW